ncbi:uncharacterized protein LOC116426735 isoform X1 [Nomia melanderi]|uniref:uncharacterized protein LOC116426735 isoform X1 n=2 Tax=Nomia melanderi TaxID=2448451 RepID=UPI0013044701|nr:uncharacterized protein LOC116426735 [Nomia melanderi]XP_031831983.1 uncharacterized protein LOC116426735 [Nomia melanderi]XP_031831984.1 uncharacterized protein LOC116426735 [Nomia melanderi]XP_031831985.1 uncharacterized protein LOC116426735 [Nomia melanderi]
MCFLGTTTPNSLEYRYFPTTRSRINLRIKAGHDARICLRTHLGSDSNIYEIVIGGWGNTMSAIKKNGKEPCVAEAETKDILNTEQLCDLWIQWLCDGLLNVGRQNGEILMSYKDPNPFVINYIGVSTAWGATGEFFIEESQCTSTVVRQQLVDTSSYWIDYNELLGLPRNVTLASEDGLYVGRTHHRDSLTPGSVRNSMCTIAWGGTSYNKKEFQVLCAENVSWVQSWDGNIPMNALPAGESEDGYALFIGRVLHEGTYYIGKIQPNHQVCYVPVDGKEESYINYEALVIHDIEEHVGR